MAPQPRIRTALLLVTFLAALGSMGCGGSDGGTDIEEEGAYFLRFDANGSRVSYALQTSLLATFGQSGSQRNMIVMAFDANSNAGLQIYDVNPIGQATYSGYRIAAQGAGIVGVLMHYQNTAGTLFGSTGVNLDETFITITSLTATTARGTFRGKLRTSAGAEMTISNGEFYVLPAN